MFASRCLCGSCSTSGLCWWACPACCWGNITCRTWAVASPSASCTSAWWSRFGWTPTPVRPSSPSARCAGPSWFSRSLDWRLRFKLHASKVFGFWSQTCFVSPAHGSGSGAVWLGSGGLLLEPGLGFTELTRPGSTLKSREAVNGLVWPNSGSCLGLILV